MERALVFRLCTKHFFVFGIEGCIQFSSFITDREADKCTFSGSASSINECLAVNTVITEEDRVFQSNFLHLGSDQTTFGGIPTEVDRLWFLH